MAEVELPNPEELEELKARTFTRRVALTTAIFAVVLAIASLGGNNATKEMLLAQQQASDQWAFYQAKVIREHQYRAQKLRLEVELAELARSKARGAEEVRGAHDEVRRGREALQRREKGHREGSQEAGARARCKPRQGPVF